MERVQATLLREKSFSTHVSHELRTPVAELKLTAEMGKTFPQDTNEVQRYFGEVSQISQRMEELVTQLIYLSRTEHGHETHPFEALDRGEMLLSGIPDEAKSWFDVEGIDEAEICSDPELLHILLQNLLSNAWVHRKKGSRCFCKVIRTEEGILLQIENKVMNFEQADLERISESFWQKDPARTSGEHFGLGLSIVQSISKLLDLQLTFSLPDRQTFRAELHFFCKPSCVGSSTLI
jgi:two-component system sensor histidine kinase QseC